VVISLVQNSWARGWFFWEEDACGTFFGDAGRDWVGSWPVWRLGRELWCGCHRVVSDCLSRRVYHRDAFWLSYGQTVWNRPPKRRGALQIHHRPPIWVLGNDDETSRVPARATCARRTATGSSTSRGNNTRISGSFIVGVPIGTARATVSDPRWRNASGSSERWLTVQATRSGKGG
jgi:hypothetical protein